MTFILKQFLTGLAIPLVALLNAAGYPLQQTARPDLSLDIYHLQEKVSIHDTQLETLKNEVNSYQAPDLSHNLGATFVAPVTVALFSTSLQSAVTSSQTTMTLVSGAYNNGASTLASSTYAFIIDEGTVSQEFVIADCTSITCTNMQRGLDFLTGTSSVTSLQFSHRRGATVKITDAPILLMLSNIIRGAMAMPVPIKYSSTISTTTLAADRNNVASAGLVADTAFAGAGVINATPTARGIVQLATGTQIASSTATCSSTAPCVISADNATSTFNSATAALKVVATKNSGKIDSGFLDLSTYTGSITLASTTQIGSFPAYQIGKTFWFATTTSTFTVPTGVTVFDVACVGGGGAGGAVASNNAGAGGGGGSGAYLRKAVDLTGVSTVTVTIPAAATGNASAVTFGTYISVNGGFTGGSVNLGSGGPGAAQGGSPGAASTTAISPIINSAGGYGQFGFVSNASSNVLALGGTGGASVFGSGGVGNTAAGSGDGSGAAGAAWGSGGGGAEKISAAPGIVAGGSGAPGACTVIY